MKCGTQLMRRCLWLLTLAFFAGTLTSCSLSSSSSGSGGGGGGGGSGTHSVSLAWHASTSANVVGYNVYRGTTSGNYGLLNSMNSTTRYTDTTVQNGQTYFYVVTAVDSAGSESPHSNPAEAVIP
jgi:hypothetical protein